MANVKFSDNKLMDIAFMGMRAAIGAVFIAHGVGKLLNPGFAGFLSGPLGLPAELAIVIALAEAVGGILLVFGVVSRIASGWLSIIMLGAIFHVKGAASLTGERGTELDVVLLGALLVLVVAGPGRVSIPYAVKQIPRFLH